MSDQLHHSIVAEIIGQRFRMSEFDLVDIIPVPLDDGVDHDEMQQYLLQIKPKKKVSPPVASTQIGPEQIYHPDGSLNASFLFRNAELLSGCGEYELAKNIYKKIAQAGQSAASTSRALFLMGNCCENEGNREQARHCYEQSIAFQPALETYQRLADLLISQKKDRPAAETLERAIALKDLSAKARFGILEAAANAWMRAGEMAAAERAFKKALEVDPSADGIQASLGNLYLQAGKYTEARRKFQDTLASNPRNDQAIIGLGMCFVQEGNKREAHDHFARALEINLRNQQAVYHLVKCAYELKSYATAARIVESYIQVAPVNINLLYSLGGLQFHLGRMADATATLQQTLQLTPSHTGAKDLLRRIENLSCHGGQGHNGN